MQVNSCSLCCLDWHGLAPHSRGQPRVTLKVTRDEQGFSECRELRTYMSSYSILRTAYAQPNFKTPLCMESANTLIMH